MDNTNRRKWLTITGAALAGVAVGAAVGVLYAPKKGEETRADVKNWLNAKREQTKGILAKGKALFGQKKESIAAVIRNGRLNLGHKVEVKEKELVA